MSRLEVLEKKVPIRISKIIRVIWTQFREIQISIYDKERYNKHRFRSIKKASLSQLEGKILFHTHAIEKGLSHKKMRYGFGTDALRSLSEVMSKYSNKGFNTERDIYQNALSVLKEYIAVHRDSGQPYPLIRRFFPLLLESILESEDVSGGIITVSSETKELNSSLDFRELFNNRVSVREYADSNVDISKIKSAINISMKSPSVCNRQSGRVHILSDKKVISRVLRIQGGFNGYETPPVMLVVTSDTGRFISPAERNQPYIDGGLLSMSLLLSLEYESVAACPLNAMLNKGAERKIRNAAQIPDNEIIIMFIAVGNFAEVSKAPKSFRVRADSITVIH